MGDTSWEGGGTHSLDSYKLPQDPKKSYTIKQNHIDSAVNDRESVIALIIFNTLLCYFSATSFPIQMRSLQMQDAQPLVI